MRRFWLVIGACAFCVAVWPRFRITVCTALRAFRRRLSMPLTISRPYASDVIEGRTHTRRERPRDYSDCLQHDISISSPRSFNPIYRTTTGAYFTDDWSNP